jgi:hypothetical protein
MSLDVFFKLYSTIKPALQAAILSKSKKKDARDVTKIHPINGIITGPARLACAIRFWAGGDPYDLGVMFGISYSEVFKCVDISLEAINQTEALKIRFPKTMQNNKK